jgi:hypothetical protein
VNLVFKSPSPAATDRISAAGDEVRISPTEPAVDAVVVAILDSHDAELESGHAQLEPDGTWRYALQRALPVEINTSMPDYVVHRVADALNDQGKPLKGSKILLLGMAYKANVDDDRESPSYVLMEKLEAKGATVEYNDPHVPLIRPSREHSHFAGRKSQQPKPDGYDVALVATAHDEYRQMDFSDWSIPIVDTRNCIKSRPNRYYSA